MKKYSTILVFLFAALSFVLLFKFLNENKLLIEQKETYEKHLKFNEIRILNIENNYLSNCFQEGNPIPYSLLLYNKKSETIPIKNIFKNNHKLIFFFPSNACTSCFDTSVLNYLVLKIKYENILIISTIDKYKSRLNDLVCEGPLPEMLSITEENAKYFSSNNERPTILAIDYYDFRPKYHIIVDKSNSSTVKKYIDILSKKYF